MLTTSKAEEDIARTYDLGVNSFITKPVTFDGLVQAMDAFSRYWLEIVELPNARSRTSVQNTANPAERPNDERVPDSGSTAR